MTFQMMYSKHRTAPGKSQTGGKTGSDQQSADEARPCGIGHAVNRFPVRFGRSQRLPNQRQEPANMVPGGQFGHHAAIGLMHCDLAVQAMRQQAKLGIVDGHRRLVTGALNSDYPHRPPPAPISSPTAHHTKDVLAAFAFYGGAP